MKNKTVPSVETQQEAMKIAKATQKPSQTKEQTKLVAQGIEKGIALYKKQQKQKSREADKVKKKAAKHKIQKKEEIAAPIQEIELQGTSNASFSRRLPWILLVVSWIGFIAYLNLPI